MTVTVEMILRSDGEKRPMLPLDVEWDTGLALYCRQRWPVGRRKAVEAEWDLTVDDARSVVEGKASKRIIARIWKHPRGGWAVAIPVMGAVIGRPLHDFLRQQTIQATKAAADALEHQALATAAWSRLESRSFGPGVDRDAGAAAGTLEPEASRRVADRR